MDGSGSEEICGEERTTGDELRTTAFVEGGRSLPKDRLAAHAGHNPPDSKKHPETERAARQQGSSFLRENSSNGGKAIRTFWLHSRCGGAECQE